MPAEAETWESSTPGTYTFTVPSGVTSLDVTAIGGGGGGGGSSSGTNNWGMGGAGGGGGAAETTRRTLSVTPGQTLYIWVGAGGARGLSDAYNTPRGLDGSNGGVSEVWNASVGSVSADGGTGGKGGVATGMCFDNFLWYEAELDDYGNVRSYYTWNGENQIWTTSWPWCWQQGVTTDAVWLLGTWDGREYCFPYQSWYDLAPAGMASGNGGESGGTGGVGPSIHGYSYGGNGGSSSVGTGGAGGVPWIGGHAGNGGIGAGGGGGGSSGADPNDNATLAGNGGPGYVKIDYSVSFTYSWSSGTFGACSLSCGGGTQTRTVTCLRSDGVAVADSNCDANTRPASSQACNAQACPVNGLCSAAHYGCAAGDSVSNAQNTTSWTWACNGQNGGTNASCSEGIPSASLSVSPNPVPYGTAPTFTVTASNANYCYISVDGVYMTWGYSVTSGTSHSFGVFPPGIHSADIYCYNANWSHPVPDQWTPTIFTVLEPTLKLCNGGCASGIRRDTGGMPSFQLRRGASERLYACYGGGACTSNDSAVSATWNESNPNSAVLISPTTGTSTVVNGTGQGSEQVTARYLTPEGTTVTASAIANVQCDPSNTCSTDPRRNGFCPDQTFIIEDGCGGTVTCSGTRSCDYNWKEVAP